MTDIQRDHPEIIANAMALLGEDGVRIFSTNLRKFRLDPALANRCAIEDRRA